MSHAVARAARNRSLIRRCLRVIVSGIHDDGAHGNAYWSGGRLRFVFDLIQRNTEERIFDGDGFAPVGRDVQGDPEKQGLLSVPVGWREQCETRNRDRKGWMDQCVGGVEFAAGLATDCRQVHLRRRTPEDHSAEERGVGLRTGTKAHAQGGKLP